MKNTKLFIIVGLPGVGKGTVLSTLAKQKELGLVRALSVTTRPPGIGEYDGKDYHFISPSEFANLRRAVELFGGTTPQFGFEYGVRKRDITDPRRRGQSVIMESNLLGLKLAKTTFPGVIGIFLRPPSESNLRQRLLTRGRDDQAGVEMRIEDGHRMLECVSQYPIDYVVVNDDLVKCVTQLTTLLLRELRAVNVKNVDLPRK